MNQAKFKIRQLAQQIINNQIDFIEGCRKVTQLSNYLNNSDIERLDKHLLVIKGISSSKRSLSRWQSQSDLLFKTFN